MSRVVAVVLAVLLAGCGVLDGDEEEVMAVWDLRDTRSVEAVGWPEDAGSSFEANSAQGLERILLPGDVVVEGEFRANPSRHGMPGVVPYGDELRSLVVTFERESVEEVMERARAHAEQLGGVDLDRLDAWASANADGQDQSAGGATALSGRATPESGGPSVQLETRAFPDGDALLRLLVSWRDASDS